MNTKHPNAEFLTKSQLATLLNLSERTLDRYSYTTEEDKRRIEQQNKRPLRRYYAGRRVLYRTSEVFEWLGIQYADSEQVESATLCARVSEGVPLRRRTRPTSSPQMSFWDLGDTR